LFGAMLAGMVVFELVERLRAGPSAASRGGGSVAVTQSRYRHGEP
jgi:hypothetical protein